MTRQLAVKKLNQKIFSWPDSHPARRFLEAFIACRCECVGREIEYDDRRQIAITDQQWISSVDGRLCRFSSFAYESLAFDIVLDGCLSDAPAMTESEANDLRELPRLKKLMLECKDAALRDQNHEVLAMTECVVAMLDLWENCIKSRIESLAN